MKKVLFCGAVLLTCVGLFAGGTQARAFTAGDASFLPGGANAGQAGYHDETAKEEAEIDAIGVFKEWDPGNPGGPVDPDPGGDNKWVKVNVPKTILFGTTDVNTIGETKNTEIFGPKYMIKNLSIKDVAISVKSFNWDEDASDNNKFDMSLYIQPVDGSEKVDLLTEAQPDGGDLNTDLVRLTKDQEYQFTLKGIFKPRLDFSFDKEPVFSKYKLVLNFEAIVEDAGSGETPSQP